jgi:hypothetical protein
MTVGVRKGVNTNPEARVAEVSRAAVNRWAARPEVARAEVEDSVVTESADFCPVGEG